MTMPRQELKAIFDKIAASRLRAIRRKKVSPKALTGTWVNCDKKTGGLVKVVISSRRGILMVNAYGACHPRPCNWGLVRGLAYADSVGSLDAVAFSAMYKFSFKEVIVVGHLCCGCMIIETYNHFTDGSGRSDYYSQGCFYRP
jgi:hypothetical protein